MGTTYKVVLINYDDSEAERNVFNVLNSVNKEMSTYLNDSLISQINKSALFEWVGVSENFIKVLNFASFLCFDTNGAYDVSIGRLVNLHGFGPTTKDNSYKQNDKELLGQVGCDSIETEGLSVRRLKDVHLDFSSIAKGYAIDLVHEDLVLNKDINTPIAVIIIWPAPHPNPVAIIKNK